MIIKNFKKKFICLVAYLLWFIIEYVLTRSGGVSYYRLAIIIILNLTFQVLLLNILEIKIISFASVFLLVGQVFQFGNILLFAINYDFSSYVWYRYSQVEDKYLVEAAIYALYCVNALFVGMIISLKKEKENNYKPIVVNAKEYKLFGEALFIPALILFAVIQIYNIYLVNKSGVYYKNIYNSIPSTFITLSNLVYVGIYFKMVANLKLENKTKVRIWFIVGIVLALLSMIMGVRSTGMCILIFWIILYYLTVEKLSFKKVIKWGLYGIVLLSFLNSIMYMRKSGFAIDTLFAGMIEALGNIIFDTLEEFGQSIYVLTHTITMHATGFFEHNSFGVFIHEFVLAVPGLSGLFPEWVNEGYVNLGLNNLGTSYIADVYYYMGSLGVPFMAFFGAWLGRVDTNFRKFAANGDYYSLGSRFLFYILILSEIRSPFRFGYKQILLSIFVFYVVRKCLGIKRLKLKERIEGEQ